MTGFIEIEEAIAQVMRITGKSRRQAKAILAEAIRKGEWKIGKAFKVSKATFTKTDITPEDVAKALEENT